MYFCLFVQFYPYPGTVVSHKQTLKKLKLLKLAKHKDDCVFEKEDRVKVSSYVSI